MQLLQGNRWIRVFCLALALPLFAAAQPSVADLEPAAGLAESWDSIHINGQKVGHMHTLTDRVDAGGQTVLKTRQETAMTTVRFGNKMEMKIDVTNFETEKGKLYAVDARTKMANIEQRTRGRLGNDGKFEVTIATPGKETQQSLDWPKGILGPYAQEVSLESEPLKPGETRTFLTFLPELNQVVTRKLSALRLEKTELMDGTETELLLVEETNDAIDVKSSLWLDEKGQVQKTFLSLAGMPMTTYRTTRSEALGTPVGDGLDLGIQTLVKLDKPIPQAHQTESVTYRLEMADSEAADAIPEAPYQKILERSGNNLRVKVQRKVPPPGAPVSEVAAEYLASNGFIQADNPKIVATAKAIVGSTQEPWEKVLKLERWVDENMTNRDFSIGFATAGEVIETRQGDCTEHAVLLAALCRAAGVPARVAMGLVYLEGSKELGYHMWTEVGIGGTWYAVDGTLGQGYVSGGHIKLADGSLKGATAMSTFLPIFKVIGKLKVQVEAFE